MPSKYIPQKIKDEVRKRAKGSCEYCKCLKKFVPGSFACEHINPSVRGGTYNLDNLAECCSGCNQSKFTAISAPDPHTNQSVPLYHPRKDNWRDHFKWSEDLLKMEGLTPTGRATIIRLQTNREELINLRKITIGIGHPPD